MVKEPSGFFFSDSSRICCRALAWPQADQTTSLVTSDLDMTYAGNCCQCRFALENRHNPTSSCDPGHEPPMTTLPKCAHCSIFPRSRRSLLATLAGAATALVVPLHHPTVASPGSPDDETFMRIAIEEARQADFPYGAVIVRDGDILARGRNRGRPHRARRNRCDPACLGPARQQGAAGRYALHVRGTVRHVHGRNSVVPF
jgi:hypothetical protein